MTNPNQQPEKLTGTSLDIPAEKRAQLKQLFPSAFTESQNVQGEIIESIDFEKLKAELGTFSDLLENRRERYGMDWPGKKEALRLIQTPSRATLKPCREESVNFDSTENLYIEGDNLEVLKLLQKSYYGQVKMIYIDPPYNTGKEFIYPDNYAEDLQTYLEYAGLIDGDGKKFSTNTANEGRFHTKWLNMMYPRLYLARNLLRDDGVIFITIDDNELSNLKKLCDEVFGEENFVANVIWQHSIQPKGYLGKFSVHHNYILIYSKSQNFILGSLDRTEEHNKAYANPDNDPKGLWRSGDVRNSLYRPNLIFDIFSPSGNIIKPPSNGWRWSKETIAEKISTGEIIFNQTETSIIRKIYLETVEGRAPETIWFGKEVGTTRDGNKSIKELFENNTPFETPKPVELIIKMMELIRDKSESQIILDFFAGSATTAHAILNMNKQDGGDRKFILVQLPEPCDEDSEAFKAGFRTISDIGKERIRRVIKKLNDKQEGKLDLENDKEQDRGFRVFKLDQSNFKQWNTLPPTTVPDKILEQLELHIDHISETASQEDLLFEILLKAGFMPTAQAQDQTLAGKKVFSIAEGALLICLEDAVTKELIDEVVASEPMQFICLDAAFGGNDQLKANAVQTFAAHNMQKEKHNQIIFRTV
ncbi:MAG: site-specific DNA-methyltransferase [Syntrophomonadaceae bacterium]|nr:site-specific DNA-methyltransferase [Syntrophomonadaceae bacterium]